MSATKLRSDKTPFNFPRLSPTASLGIAEDGNDGKKWQHNEVLQILLQRR